jgi:heme exporter protein B
VWGDAVLVAGKDLRIELRSRVAVNQILPFAFVVLLLFAFALDPGRDLLDRAAPGLFWVAVLLTSLLATQRSFALEAADGARDGLRLSGLDPAGIFLGKAAAVAAQLLAVEALLLLGIAFLYGTALHGFGLLLLTCVLATAGLAGAGTVYGVMAAGARVRETLLPLLVLPVLAPVLLAATRVFEHALTGAGGDARGWIGVLVCFVALYAVVGVLAFGTLLEET